jgi:hypothetical protein
VSPESESTQTDNGQPKGCEVDCKWSFLPVPLRGFLRRKPSEGSFGGPLPLRTRGNRPHSPAGPVEPVKVLL